MDVTTSMLMEKYGLGYFNNVFSYGHLEALLIFPSQQCYNLKQVLVVILANG